MDEEERDKRLWHMVLFAAIMAPILISTRMSKSGDFYGASFGFCVGSTVGIISVAILNMTRNYKTQLGEAKPVSEIKLWVLYFLRVMWVFVSMIISDRITGLVISAARG